MIPFLIYILVKKYRIQHRISFLVTVSKFIKNRYQFLLAGLLIILIALIPFLSKSQTQRLNYKILKGSDEIGWMQLNRNVSGNKTTLELISEVKTRVIFLIKVCAKETSAYENGKLVVSTQFRKTNGEVKLDKQTKFVVDKYEINEKGERQTLDLTHISTNLLCLYFREPVGTNVLYSDKHECFVNITITNDGGYKVKFPDDNSNTFYYSGGVCTKVKVEHHFYTATVIIKP